MTGSIWDYNTTPGSNSAIAGINIAPGCPASGVGPFMRQIMADVKGSLIALASGGTADAITATAAPAPTALIDGMRVLVRAGAANATTTPTFQLNALGAVGTIKKLGGTALVPGDISGVGHAIELEYVSSDNHWELLNPAKGVGTVAVANGGTGATTLTAHGVLVGEGTGAIVATAAGTAGQVLTSNGASADPTFQAPPQIQDQTFTASGTFTAPAGTTTATRYKFTIIGAGGGGGSANSAAEAGGGGGAGATAIYYGTGVAAGATAAVTVGAGGVGTVGAETSGGNSSVVFNGVTVTAGGGVHGTRAANAAAPGGNGGTASNGTLNIAGGAGTSGLGAQLTGGTGGASTCGGGGAAGFSAPGSAGGNYGAGGGGSSNAAGAAGGTGAPGVVIVEWVQ